MMSEASALSLELAGLLLCYGLLDWALRREGLSALEGKWLLGLPFFLLGTTIVWTWPKILPLHIGPTGALDGFRAVSVFLLTITTWNAITRDYDIVSGSPSGLERLFTALLCALSWFSPGPFLLTVALLSHRFHFWQHHASFPMRGLLLSAAGLICWAATSALLPVFPADVARLASRTFPAALVIFLTALFVSHYFITALAKIFLGPRPWSWTHKNRLHYLAASAYSWGWANFIPWPMFRRLVHGVRRVERPLQAFVFLIEVTVVFSFLDARLAAFFSLTFAAFHVGVCLIAGLLFWDWILMDLALALLFWGLPPEVKELSFGVVAQLFGTLVLVVFPLRHRLWKPIPLGWYDTPLTQRVAYVVRGQSGQTYGLYNDFMCPHERLYGKVAGCFAFGGTVLTYHLGEAFRLDLRDAIVVAGPNPERLATVKKAYGIEPWSMDLTRMHMLYLKEFFLALQRGARKSPLRGPLRFLKAPGDQLYYWGRLPPYRQQEPAAAIDLIYVEEYFDGQEHQRLCEELILTVPIRAAGSEGATAPVGAPQGVRELTPRELDEHLLALSVGRLIDVEGFRRKYLGGDDGRPLSPPLRPPPDLSHGGRRAAELVGASPHPPPAGPAASCRP